MQELVDTVNKIEKIVLDSLSSSDREILALYVSQQLELATNEKVRDGLTELFHRIKSGWTDFEESPACISVKHFSKNIFTLTPFQYRVAFLCETYDNVKNIFYKEIYPNVSQDKTLLFLVAKIVNSFRDMLGEGINFKGLPNNDSYYETHKRDYEIVVEVHKEITKRDCALLREIFEELQ